MGEQIAVNVKIKGYTIEIAVKGKPVEVTLDELKELHKQAVAALSQLDPIYLSGPSYTASESLHAVADICPECKKPLSKILNPKTKETERFCQEHGVYE